MVTPATSDATAAGGLCSNCCGFREVDVDSGDKGKVLERDLVSSVLVGLKSKTPNITCKRHL